MKKPGTPLLFVIFAVGGMAAAAAAQQPTRTPAPPAAAGREPRSTPGVSLAEEVKRSRQKTKPKEPKKKSLGVITNENLKSDKKPASHVSGTVSVPEGPTPAIGADAVDFNGLTEREWRERAASLKKDMTETAQRVRKLESEAKRLENDFYAWSDGNYRDNVIKPSWERTKQDLQDAQANLERIEAENAGLQEEARKAGAPPGWVR